jgi:hypothetical protein
MRKIIETYQRNLKEITNEMSGKPSENNEDAQKFEILAAKEKEI